MIEMLNITLSCDRNGFIENNVSTVAFDLEIVKHNTVPSTPATATVPDPL